MSRRVAIHYRRPPDHVRVYDQRVVFEESDVIVTISDPLELDEPLKVHGTVGLEQGSQAVWFTFPGAWHDIGRFHLADGTLTGIYANVLTPPRIEPTIWHTTDLWLDVWIGLDGSVHLLDEDEFEEGVARGLIDDGMATRARSEANMILERAAAGSWPPAIVDEWTLERCLRVTRPD